MVQKLRKHKGRHLSIFNVMLWVNILSIVIVSGFNYFVFHRMSNNAYLESYVQNNRNVMETAFRNIDQHIMQPVLQIAQIHFSLIQENIPLLRLQEGGISSGEITDFLVEMNRLQRSYPFIESLDIYYEGTGIAVTGFNRVHYPESKERLYQYLPWYQAQQEEEIIQGFMTTSTGAYLIEEPVITYVKEVSQHKWNGKSIILAIHISPYSIGEYINEQDGGLAVLTPDGYTIYDTASFVMPQLSAEVILAHAERAGIHLEEDGKPVSFHIDENYLTIFHTVSPKNGLQYLYRIENSRFYEEYDITKQMFLMNFVISIGFNLLMLGLISYYNYRTYRKRVLLASKEAGLLKEAENYSFNSSLNMLTQEISVLHKTIHTSKRLLYQKEVRSILLNKNPEPAYEILHEYLAGSHVRTFFLYMREEEDRRLSAEQLQEEYAPGMRKYNVLFTTLEKVSLVAVMICDREQMDSAEHELVDDIRRRWENSRIISGLMLPVQDDGINKSYKSTAMAAAYGYILTQKMMITYEELQIDKRKNDGSHMRLFEMIERDMKSENLHDFKFRLKGLIVSFKSESYTIEYCSSTLRDLVTLLYRIMRQNQMDMWVMFGYDIREYYKQIPDIDEFYEWSSYLGETIIQNIHQKKKTVDLNLKTRFTSFIEENIENGITLEHMAGELGIRRELASRIFSQTMGQRYTEYIKQKKLDRSIELMEKGRTIKEISEILGYSSAQYFIKIFKESYGITPYQYKKKTGEKGSGLFEDDE